MARVVSLLLLACLVAACGGGSEGSAPPAETADGSAAEAGEGLTAVATVFPLSWIATQVAPGADVTFLGARGQDPHDLELSPGDREVVETADVLLYMGELDFQPQVEAAAASTRGRIVDVADVAGHDRMLAFDHDHDDHDDHDRGRDEDGARDPHLWFDARVMADVTERAGAAFAAADPARAEDYEAAAGALADDLRELEGEIDALLAGCRHETAIVSHEAYAYLLEPRGLHQEGISGAGGHGEASPQRLAELTARIRDEGIPAVGAEPVEGRADAEALADEARVDLVEIDPLENAPEGVRAFPDALREQAEAFAHLLGCDGAP